MRFGKEQAVTLKSGLGTKVLRDVSRSFYLSLRFLPGGFREPASVGYLLARLSDTIADAGGASVETRLQLLHDFKTSFAIADLDQLSGLSEGEQILVSRASDCIDSLNQLPEWQQDSVRKVVEIITEGQTWDLTRFQGEGVVQLENDAELQQYTYQVAGCVGEFWTELGFGLGEFASASPETMSAWGRKYGQSLQLINILRDEKEDLALGRKYLPEGGRQRWFEMANQGFEDAERYCHALYGKRMRFATWLPLLIGRETLALLERHPGDRVKVSRRDVKRLMVKAGYNSLR